MSAPAAPAPLDALVERGVAAAKQGEHQQALALLAEALARDPRHELAWLWLSGVVATDAERRALQESVMQGARHGTSEQRRAVREQLDNARREMYRILAQGDASPIV